MILWGNMDFRFYDFHVQEYECDKANSTLFIICKYLTVLVVCNKQDITYTVINYIFDDGENIAELSFGTINTKEEPDAVDGIINSILKK